MIISNVANRSLSSRVAYDNHAQVVKFEDTSTGLRGYIAIHRKIGKFSTGGTRFYPYKKDEDALDDVLRLSKAMTSKCIVSGLPYGGAKAVIIGDPQTDKTLPLLNAYADAVISLHGAFRTGEDVGMTEQDVQHLIVRSEFFNGRSDVAGDPSPYAGMSVFMVMKKAAQLHLKKDTLSGLTVAVRGMGKVGRALVTHLIGEGAHVIGADVDQHTVAKMRSDFPLLEIVHPDTVDSVPCDIYAPCALGDDVTEQSVDRIKTKIICGGANNQLQHPSLAEALADRGILFVPDYLANAGGLINVSDELEPDGYRRERVIARIDQLGSLLESLYTRALTHSTSLSFETEAFVKQRSHK